MEISERNSQKNSSFGEMVEVNDVIKPPPFISSAVQNLVKSRKASVDSQKSISIYSNQQNNHQSNFNNPNRVSQASNYDILPRKAVSKIEIEKNNPDDHIVASW